MWKLVRSFTLSWLSAFKHSILFKVLPQAIEPSICWVGMFRLRSPRSIHYQEWRGKSGLNGKQLVWFIEKKLVFNVVAYSIEINHRRKYKRIRLPEFITPWLFKIRRKLWQSQMLLLLFWTKIKRNWCWKMIQFNFNLNITLNA